MQPTLEQRLAARQRPADQWQVMFQTWHDLLFLHWSFAPEIIQSSLPPGLTVDTWEGKAYLGIVPFLMRNIRPRFLPAVPGISNFHEINLRTYVYDKHGRPGVWFYSLDANQWLAVRTARALFQLPYFDAQMSHSKDDFQFTYSSKRKQEQKSPSRFDYARVSPIGFAKPGSFEFFLVERYLLFAYRRNGQLYSGQVVHKPYDLHTSLVTSWDTGLIELAGFKAPNRPPDHTLFSRGVNVDVFPIQKIV